MQKWYFQSGRLYLRNNEHVYLCKSLKYIMVNSYKGNSYNSNNQQATVKEIRKLYTIFILCYIKKIVKKKFGKCLYFVNF